MSRKEKAELLLGVLKPTSIRAIICDQIIKAVRIPIRIEELASEGDSLNCHTSVFLLNAQIGYRVLNYLQLHAPEDIYGHCISTDTNTLKTKTRQKTCRGI